MRSLLLLAAALLVLPAVPVHAAAVPPAAEGNRYPLHDQLYVDKKVREAFETWVDPGYIQHNPLAQIGPRRGDCLSRAFLRATSRHRLLDQARHRGWQPGGGAFARALLRRRPRPRGGGHPAREGCKVMEHWDVVQPVPEKSANPNSMF